MLRFTFELTKTMFIYKVMIILSSLSIFRILISKPYLMYEYSEIKFFKNIKFLGEISKN